MQRRTPELTRFLQTLQSALELSACKGSPASMLVDRIMSSLVQPHPPAELIPQHQPLCSTLADSVQQIRERQSSSSTPSALADLAIEHAVALLELSNQLRWWMRPDADKAGESFARGHVNATIIGKGGLEERRDVWIGISLLAPEVPYPEHQHPPEEVYLALSPGQWQQNAGDWHEPGIGGNVYTPSNIRHSMRSGTTPLLTTWCLGTNAPPTS